MSAVRPPEAAVTYSSDTRSPVVTNTRPPRSPSRIAACDFSAWTYVLEYSPGQKSTPPSL